MENRRASAMPKFNQSLEKQGSTPKALKFDKRGSKMATVYAAGFKSVGGHDEEHKDEEAKSKSAKTALKSRSKAVDIPASQPLPATN